MTFHPAYSPVGPLRNSCRTPVKLRDVRSAVRSTVPGAFITALLASCGDGADVVGPDSLSTFARSVVEEIAVDQVMDLLWVVDSAAGGEIRCGSRLWADLVFAPGEPLQGAWRE